MIKNRAAPDKHETASEKPAVSADPHLTSLKAKLTLVKDRVRSVAHGWSTGLYLWGEGGTSKTWTVEQSLKQLGKSYKLTNSRLTGKGLFELLEQWPESIHVLDDLESMLADKNSHGVLRSALWGTEDRSGVMERLVTWQISGSRKEFVFTGGIIIIANRPLDAASPILRALSSRIAVLHHKPTPDELIALMRFLANGGYRYRGLSLTAQECHEIVDEAVRLAATLQRPIDMRLFINGRMDRLQFMAGQTETHWKDMLESRVKQCTPRVSNLPQQQDESEPKFKVV